MENVCSTKNNVIHFIQRTLIVTLTVSCETGMKTFILGISIRFMFHLARVYLSILFSSKGLCFGILQWKLFTHFLAMYFSSDKVVWCKVNEWIRIIHESKMKKTNIIRWMYRNKVPTMFSPTMSGQQGWLHRHPSFSDKVYSYTTNTARFHKVVRCLGVWLIVTFSTVHLIVLTTRESCEVKDPVCARMVLQSLIYCKDIHTSGKRQL